MLKFSKPYHNPHIYIYSQSDVDHSLRCCRLGLMDMDGDHPLMTFLKKRDLVLTNFTKHTVDKYDGILYKGLSIDFIDDESGFKKPSTKEKFQTQTLK